MAEFIRVTLNAPVRIRENVTEGLYAEQLKCKDDQKHLETLSRRVYMLLHIVIVCGRMNNVGCFRLIVCTSLLFFILFYFLFTSSNMASDLHQAYGHTAGPCHITTT